MNNIRTVTDHNIEINRHILIKELKTYICIFLPLVISEIIYGLNGFFGTMMLSNISNEYLATHSLVFSIYVPVILISIGFLCAVSAMISQSFGAKDRHGVSICFKQGLIIAILFSIPVLLIMFYIPNIFHFFIKDQQILALSKTYMYSLTWSILPINIFVVVTQFFAGINRTRLTMYMNTIIVPIEIFFYYVFLFGKFGIHKIGICGIGYAIAISTSIVLLMSLIYLHLNKDFKQYDLFKKWWIINDRFLVELLKLGWPLCISFCSDCLLFAVLTIMIGTFGTNELASYQIAMQYFMILCAVFMALTQCTTIRVGNYVGKENEHGIRITMISALIIGFLFIIPCSILLMFFPKFLVNLDISAGTNGIEIMSLIKEISSFMFILGGLAIIDYVRCISIGALRGIKDTKSIMVISVLGFWFVAFPCAYLLGFRSGFGSNGILYGLAIGLVATSIIMIWKFYKELRGIDLAHILTKS